MVSEDYKLNLEQTIKGAFVREHSLCRPMEPMSSHTSFRIGGPAELFVCPASEEDLRRVLAICREKNTSWKILGNGSDLLVSDKGCEGVVISTEGLKGVKVTGNLIRAGGGELLGRTAFEALSHSLSGLEFAAGIPGSAGGALVMNAGAYGFEIKDILKEARVMTARGEVLCLKAEELELGYRTSCIPGKGYIVLEAAFELKPGDKTSIENRMKELALRRREKQPLEYPSAGSTFKRPAGCFAGKLIEDAGLRGYRIGGAQVSEKHCGFVINRDHATAGQVMELCSHIRRTVKEMSGVELEMEVKRWGEF